jgi:hypothetical protein
MKKHALALLLLSSGLFFALPAAANLSAPRLTAPTLAQPASTELQYLEQSFVITRFASVNVDEAAHTAQLKGRGSAVLDNGLNSVNAAGDGLELDITLMNTESPGLKQCIEGLVKNPPPQTIIVSGHGYFTLNQNNGVTEGLVMMLSDVTSCSVD